MHLTAIPIRLAQPALTARLRLGFPEKDFKLERVPAVMTSKEFESSTRQTPFLGLAWAGFAADKSAGREVSGANTWRLILINKASSSLQTRFEGDRRGIGLDAMIEVAVLLLHGWTIEDLGSVQVTRAEAVHAQGFEDDAMVLAQIDFEIRSSARISALGIKTLADLQQLDATWLTTAEDAPDQGPDISETITTGGNP